MDFEYQEELVRNDFKNAQNILSAIGNEKRQLIVMALIDAACEEVGYRVGDITKKIHLSRPAVSHHLKILKEANIISMRKEGTKNYYFISCKESLQVIKKLIIDIECLLEAEEKQHELKNSN